MTIPQFLKSKSTWSLLVSAIAIVLSQSPPVVNWFRGKKVAIRISKETYLGHELGGLRIFFTLDIQNTGGRTIEFDDIDCVLKKTTGEIVNLPIKAYFQSIAASQSSSPLTRFPITMVSLRPGERWNSLVTGYSEWNEADEEEINTIKMNLMDDIRKKQAVTKSSEMTWFEAEPEHVRKATDFFNQHFSLAQGQYTLYVAVKHEGQPLAVVGYPLIIYNYQIDYLKSMTNDYKYGSGVLPWVTQLRENLKLLLNQPMPESEAARGYASRQSTE